MVELDTADHLIWYSEAIEAMTNEIRDFLDGAMPAWRDDSVAHEWTKCSDGISESRIQAERLQKHDVELTFEQLNARVGDVLYPLEAFADAERDLRRR